MIPDIFIILLIVGIFYCGMEQIFSLAAAAGVVFCAAFAAKRDLQICRCNTLAFFTDISTVCKNMK
jgi:hypothetical protein